MSITVRRITRSPTGAVTGEPGTAPAGGRFRRFLSRHPVAVFLVGLVLAWELGAAILAAAEVRGSATKFPFPHVIAETLVTESGLLVSSLWVTARGALTGLVLGTVLGILVGFLMSLSRWLEEAVYPFILGGQMIPTIALAPIILTALRNPSLTRVVVATYITFFAISLGTLKGLKSTTHQALELMKSYSATRLETYRKVRFPGAVPFIFAGLKIGAPLAVVGQIVVELTGATSGLGYLILVTQYYGPVYAGLFWASMIVTLLLGLTFYQGAVLAERILSPWQQEFRAR